LSVAAVIATPHWCGEKTGGRLPRHFATMAGENQFFHPYKALGMLDKLRISHFIINK
jgi:hypothetical protein